MIRIDHDENGELIWEDEFFKPVEKDSSKYVPNNVYKFAISLDLDIPRVTVFTNENICNEVEVKKAYFTDERIKQIKNEIAKLVRSSSINIYCVDYDSEYKVTKEQIVYE